MPIKRAADPTFDILNPYTMMVIALLLQPMIKKHTRADKDIPFLFIMAAMEDALQHKLKKALRVEMMLGHLHAIYMVSGLKCDMNTIKRFEEQGWVRLSRINNELFVSTTLTSRAIIKTFKQKMRLALETVLSLENPQDKPLYKTMMRTHMAKHQPKRRKRGNARKIFSVAWIDEL